MNTGSIGHKVEWGRENLKKVSSVRNVFVTKVALLVRKVVIIQ